MRSEDDAYERDSHPAKQFGSDRPYFEVLVVEDLTEEQESSLREELRRWRQPDDQFIYEIVVVTSFDEAVMAARLDFRLRRAWSAAGSHPPVANPPLLVMAPLRGHSRT